MECSNAECVLSCSVDCEVDSGWCSLDSVMSVCEIGHDGCATMVSVVCPEATHCEDPKPQYPSCVPDA